MRPHVHHTARKHGIGDDDIVHAIEHAFIEAQAGEDKLLHLGPSHAGNFLEIISIVREADSLLVIHAMPIRKQYLALLRGLGEHDA